MSGSGENKRRVTLHYPVGTMPLSVTGDKCALCCKHCGGLYLKSMKSPEEALDPPEKITSYLVSGGCDAKGAVPLAGQVELLKKLKDSGKRLNLHTGLLSPDEIKVVAPLADVVSFDFLTDDETIREVYGHDRKAADYEACYVEMKKYADVIPHITVGLKGGEVVGEFDAVEVLANLDCKKLVFIVFIPTTGTAYEIKPPPSLEEVASVFSHARSLMPDASFGLGCMHPRGSYKTKLEMIAYDYGFDSFVNPSRKFRKFLEEEGVETIVQKECCTL